MALYRPPKKCPCCGKLLHFKHRPLSEYQKMTMWVGDNGGEYEKCDCNLPFPTTPANLLDDLDRLCGDIN